MVFGLSSPWFLDLLYSLCPKENQPTFFQYISSLTVFRSSRPQVFFEVGIHESLVKITKSNCARVSNLQRATLSRKDSSTGVVFYCKLCGIFQSSFFAEYSSRWSDDSFYVTMCELFLMVYECHISIVWFTSIVYF